MTDDELKEQGLARGSSTDGGGLSTVHALANPDEMGVKPVYYVSDLHIEHHVDLAGKTREEIWEAVPRQGRRARRVIGGDLALALVLDLEVREQAAHGDGEPLLGGVRDELAALGVGHAHAPALALVEPPLELALLAGEAVEVPVDDGVHLARADRVAELVVLGAHDVELGRRDRVVAEHLDHGPLVGVRPGAAVVFLALDALLAAGVVERDSGVDGGPDRVVPTRGIVSRLSHDMTPSVCVSAGQELFSPIQG